MSLVDHLRNARAASVSAKHEPVSRRLVAGVPLHLQIAESLLSQIELGELRPGERLPPERALSESLGVTRMTLRQALGRLEVEGHLTRRQGSGTFVAGPKIAREAGRLVPFSRAMSRRGYKPGAKVVNLEKEPASVLVARSLRLAVSSPVYLIRRVRLINREPVMLETFWMSVNRFPRFERYDITRRSVYEIMEKEYGVKLSRARQSLEPTTASAYEADLLQIETGAPLMLEERLSFDARGRPIEYGKDLYRGDRFRFVTDRAPVEW